LSSLADPKTLIANGLFPAVSGLTIYGAIGSTLDAYVRALETTNRFKILSRPSVYTTNNKLAVIANGSQVPVPSDITSGYTGATSVNSTGLTTTASVTYENVLLQLDIIPLINADHEVTLKIRQTNNTLGSDVNISGNEVPSINTQEINTEVTVRDRQTVVIGGLISDTTSRDTTGVPWLSDIPVLGYLFKDTTKSRERDELIILIQPSVVETDAEELSVNTAEKQRTILGREAADAATGFSDAPGAKQDALDDITRGLNPDSLPSSPGTMAATGTVTSVSTSTTTTKSAYNSKNGGQTTSAQATITVAPSPASNPAVTSHPDVSKGQMPPEAPPFSTP
jgi:type II secretory pathway component GspD/PulD (secretin)